MTRKGRPTDDQIEADVLAKRGHPSAWEPLPFVPPSTSPRPAWMQRNKHLELGARFHVLSVLHRLGVEANLALGQPDNVDITILGSAGQAITIDVKTVHGTADWLVEQFNARKHHYVVLVHFPPADEDVISQPNVYVVASEALKRFVSRRKLARIPLDALSRDLSALDAWRLIIAEQAA